MTEDKDYDLEEDESVGESSCKKRQKRRRKSLARSEMARAAYILLQLHMADARLADERAGF